MKRIVEVDKLVALWIHHTKTVPIGLLGSWLFWEKCQKYVPSSLSASLLLSAHVSSIFDHICITASCGGRSNTRQWRSERSSAQPMTASLIAPLSLVYRALMGPRAFQSWGQTNRDSPRSSLNNPLPKCVCACVVRICVCAGHPVSLLTLPSPAPSVFVCLCSMCQLACSPRVDGN